MTTSEENGIPIRHRGAHTAEPSVGELVSRLGSDLSLLVHQEIDLARAELRQQVSKVNSVATAMGVGSGLLYAGLLAVVAAAIIGLAGAGVAPWLAALVIGLALVAAGMFLVRHGRRELKRVDPVPRRAIRAARETVEHVKEQLT